MIFSKTLKDSMAKQGITVRDLAQTSGVPAKTIYHWLSGQQPRKIENVIKVCDVLGLSLDEIWGRPKVSPTLPL